MIEPAFPGSADARLVSFGAKNLVQCLRQVLGPHEDRLDDHTVAAAQERLVEDLYHGERTNQHVTVSLEQQGVAIRIFDNFQVLAVERRAQPSPHLADPERP